MSRRAAPSSLSEDGAKKQRTVTGFFRTTTSSSTSSSSTTASSAHHHYSAEDAEAEEADESLLRLAEEAELERKAIGLTAPSIACPNGEGYVIYCDMDGVLCDFAEGVRAICRGRAPHELPHSSVMWGSIARCPTFYTEMPWMEDGKQLWIALINKAPVLNILTGVPGLKSARTDKVVWAKRELLADIAQTKFREINHVDMAGPRSSHKLVSGNRITTDTSVINLITCWSRNKYHESDVQSVLIDDRVSLKENWEKKGGIFVHHTSTETTLAELKARGILRFDDEDGNEGNANGRGTAKRGEAEGTLSTSEVKVAATVGAGGGGGSARREFSTVGACLKYGNYTSNDEGIDTP